MPKLTKAARVASLGGPAPDYHPGIVDEFTNADGEQMVELTDGNIEPAEDWIAPPAAEPEHYIPPRPELPRMSPDRPIRHLHGQKDSLVIFGSCANEPKLDNELSKTRTHARCPGALINGDGKTVQCGCPGHVDEFKCSICGYVHPDGDNYSADHRRCTDIEDCTDRVHAKETASANTPVARMIREVKTQARGLAEAIDPVTGEVKRRVRRDPSAPRPEKREGRPCQCGCGMITGGGLFRPGHDARLKGVLKKAAKDGDVASHVEQLARGWSQPDPDLPLGSVEQGHLADEQSKQDYIASRVAARYAEQESASE